MLGHLVSPEEKRHRWVPAVLEGHRSNLQAVRERPVHSNQDHLAEVIHADLRSG